MTEKQTTHKFTFEAWQKLIDAQLARLEAVLQEAATYEKPAVEQATAAIDELARLMKDSVDYSCRLSAAWRRETLAAMKRSGELFSELARR
ncbi:MAG: hypothetical protein GYA57_19665 [Myxococcales bacterium]|nr:hypothetical protein [Myxococcales bacterium]